MKRLLAGIAIAATLATGAVIIPAAPVIARDTGWPCPGC